MAQAAQALTIAPRHTKPRAFTGSEVQWRALCDVYPNAEAPEVLLAVLDYCAIRKLDPYKRPVHIVPMWNSRVRRKVQVIMPGINEIEITASRTGKWVGMDAPIWGPLIERSFRGEAEDEQTGQRHQTNITVIFPEWCRVTVYRLVGNERAAFTEELYWEESYGRAGFRSAVPNARWQQNPRQMLHKCCKAAVLRATFPEEGLGYAAEEMEDREVEPGMTIDGFAEREAEREPPSRTQPVQQPTQQLSNDPVPEIENDPMNEANEPGAFNVATPAGSFAYIDPISWLGKWDELVRETRGRPNDLRALHAMNEGNFRLVADIDVASEVEVQRKIANALRSPR